MRVPLLPFPVVEDPGMCYQKGTSKLHALQWRRLWLEEGVVSMEVLTASQAGSVRGPLGEV